MLTKEEKINIVNSHIKALEFSLYNAQLDLLEANAGSVDSQFIAEINNRILEIESKQAALEAEKESLN